MRHVVVLATFACVAVTIVGASSCDGGISLNPADYVPHPEICNNGLDDDKNGDIDCDDVACATSKVCQLPKQHGLVGGEGEGEGEGNVGEGEGEGNVGEGEGAVGEGEGEGSSFVVTEVEPNGTPPVDFNVYAAPYTGFITPGGDRDCVSLDLGDSELVDLETTNGVDATCGIDTKIDAFDDDGFTLLQSADDISTGDTCSLLHFRAPHAGTFYFCVKAFFTDDSFDYGLDVTFPPSSCGNGVREFPEVCDQSDFGGDSCSSLGFADGSLACNASCDAVDTSECTPAVCNNGVAEGFEECDQGDFRNDSCVAHGLEDGTLTCTASCTVDTSSCPFCGDGTLNGGEACDGADLGGADCTTFGFQSGPLGCDAACNFDTSQCVPFVCGDDVKNGSEACDGTDVQGLDCTTFGFQSGALHCLGDCTDFDTSQCVPFVCGDNITNGNETCDGTDIGGHDCTTFGFASGAVSCLPDCSGFDTSQCRFPECGDGVVNQPNEECDDGNATTGDGCDSSCLIEITCPVGQTLVAVTNTTPMTIFDVSTQASPTTISAAGTVQSVRVRVDDLRHTFDNDLVLTLIGENGARVAISSRIGGSGDNYTETLFSDACTTPIGNGAPPYNGCFTPAQPLSAENGQAAAGTWQLEASDQAGQDSGVLNSWTLALCVQ